MGNRFTALLILAAPLAFLCVAPTPLNADASGNATEIALPRGCPYSNLRIELDEFEVPTIRADSTEAAYFGIGYIQAYHRLVQLDVTRRLGRGELAEMVGDSYFENDRTMRRLRLGEVADESLKLYSESERALLDAYTAGVNLYISNCAELPMEFITTGAPREWTPSDTLVCAKVISWLSMDDFFTTMYWERAKNKVDKGLFDLVKLSDLESLMTHVNSADLQMQSDGLSNANHPGDFVLTSDSVDQSINHPGSNCFVISGQHTEDGRPWLASDPHLELRFPSIWYEMRYITPSLSVRGMCIPGMPIIVFGSNSQVTWGITALGGDVADAVRYKARGLGTNKPEYLTVNGWIPLISENEEYAIMSLTGAKAEKETVYYTQDGPVFYIDGDNLFVLKWTGFLPDREGVAFLSLNHASELEDIQAAVNDMTTSQNILFCTADGHIGYMPAGKYPVRAYDGSMLVDGSKTDTTWNRFLTSDDFPSIIDPKCGYIVSANQQVYPFNAVYPSENVTNDMWSNRYEDMLGGYRSYGHRAVRIAELIDQTLDNHAVSVQDIKHIQCDTYSILGAGFRDFTLETLDSVGYKTGTAGTRLAAAYAALRNWNGRCDADSSGACVSFLMLEKVADRILEPRGYRNTYERAWNQAFDFGRKLGVYWDDPKTEQVEDSSAILKWALEEAASHLEKTLGEPDNWRWDKLHFMDLSYPVPLLGSFAPGLVGSPGGYDTPWQGSSSINDKGFLVQDFAPSMRMIATPGELGEEFLSVLPGGQSGDVTDKHSKDQLELFIKGEYKPTEPRSD
jgi:penicillin G amidase